MLPSSFSVALFSLGSQLAPHHLNAALERLEQAMFWLTFGIHCFFICYCCRRFGCKVVFRTLQPCWVWRIRQICTINLTIGGSGKVKTLSYNLVLLIGAEKASSNIKPFRPVQPTFSLFFFPSLPCLVSRSLQETGKQIRWHAFAEKAMCCGEGFTQRGLE